MKLLRLCVFGFAIVYVLSFGIDVAKAQDVNRLRNEYLSTKEEVTKKQNEFRDQYNQVASNNERSEIVHEVRSYIFETLTERIFPAWYGTPWGFNGTSRVPGERKIACGTFVIYTLQDAGFKIPSRMSRQPSENIIKNLISSADIKRFSNASIERVLNWIRTKGEGLYIVGLDIHVGFIINTGDKITFCHSSYYNPPMKVVNQDAMDRSPLVDSRYRIVGKILDDQMVTKWILGESFAITHDYFSGQTADLDRAKRIVEEMDKVAGIYINAPKDEISKRPAIKKLQEAIAMLEEVRKEKEGNYEAAFLTARAYAMLYNLDVPGSFKSTVKYAGEAMRINPEQQDPYLFLAVFYTNSSHPAEAVDCYWKALWRGKEKTHPGLLGGLATAYMYQGNSLWAYHATRQDLEYYPGHGHIKAIKGTAKSMVKEPLIDAIDIHFAPGGIIYRNKSLRYSFKVPPGWRIAFEKHDLKNNPIKHESVTMGLAHVKDDRGKEVGNVALGIAVFRRENLEEAKKFSANYLSDFKRKILKVIKEGADWFIYEHPWQGALYKGRLEAKPVDEFAYITHFTATPGTYDNNIGRFNQWYADFKRGVI